MKKKVTIYYESKDGAKSAEEFESIKEFLEWVEEQKETGHALTQRSIDEAYNEFFLAGIKE